MSIWFYMCTSICLIAILINIIGNIVLLKKLKNPTQHLSNRTYCNNILTKNKRNVNIEEKKDEKN